MTKLNYVEAVNEQSIMDFAHALQDRDYEVHVKSCGDSGMVTMLEVPAIDLVVDNLEHLTDCGYCLRDRGAA